MQIEINDNEVAEARHLLKCLDSFENIPVARLKMFLKKFERKVVKEPSAQTKRSKKRESIDLLKTQIMSGIRVRRLK